MKVILSDHDPRPNEFKAVIFVDSNDTTYRGLMDAFDSVGIRKEDIKLLNNRSGQRGVSGNL